MCQGLQHAQPLRNKQKEMGLKHSQLLKRLCVFLWQVADAPRIDNKAQNWILATMIYLVIGENGPLRGSLESRLNRDLGHAHTHTILP